MAAVIKIEVQTSGGLSEVKKDIADLGATAKESGGGFSAMGEIATGALRHIGTMAVDVAMAGLQKLGGIVQDGIADAKQNAIIQAQTAQVIKSTGEAAGVTAQHVADYATALSAASGKSLFGDDQIQQSTNLLLTFTNIKGASLDAATAISVDMAQAMGGAPKDAAIQLGKALNDPIKGITALSRVGVTFSDEQKAMIQAMQEAGDTAGAQGIILAELNKEFGGSAAAAAAADGGWAQFNDRMGEAKEAVGTALLPLLGMLAGVLNDTIAPAIEQAAAMVGPFVEQITALVERFQTGAAEGGGFIGGLTNALYGLDSISPVFDDIADGINTLADLWSQTADMGLDYAESIGFIIDQVLGFGNALGPVQSLMMGVSDAMADVSAAFSDGGLQGGIQFLIDKLAEISPGFAILKGVVEAALPAIQSIIMSVFGIIAGFIQEHGAKIQADLIGAWQAIQGLIAAALPPIQSIVASVFGAIATFLHAHGDEIKAFLATTWDQIAQIVQVAVALVKAIIVPVFTFIAGFLASHGEQIQALLTNSWNTIKAIIDGALTIIKGVLTAALQLIQGDWSGAWETIKAMSARVVEDLIVIFRGAFDNLKVMFGGFISDALKFGSDLVAGIISGVKGAASALYSTLVDLANSALKAAKDAIFSNSPSKAFADEVGTPIVTGIIQGVRSTAGSLVSTMATLTGGLVQGAGDAINKLTGVITGAEPPDSEFLGKGILEGIIDGMNGAMPKLLDVVNSTADTVEGAFKGAFGIHSPSTVLASGVGVPIILGVIDGIERTLPDLNGVIDSVFMSLVNSTKKMTEKAAEEIDKTVTDLRDKAASIGDAINGAIADAFSGTASFDRLKAKAISALKDISDAQQKNVQDQLNAADAVASAMTDPQQAAKYFKLKSDQIFEIAKLQDTISKTTDEGAKARLVAQLDLITQAQAAEQQSAAHSAAVSSPIKALTDKLSAFLTSGALPGLLDSPALNQLNTLLQQLNAASAPIAASGSGGGGSTSTSTSTTFTFAPTVNTSQSDAPAVDYATARALAMV
jgi:phage-related protein